MRYRYRKDDELKDSGVEWIGKIPKDWETLKLKRITQSVKNGIWGDDEQHNSDDIQCIRILNFDRNKMQVNIDDLTVRNIPKEKQKGYLLNKGDLLIEKSGGGEKNPVGFVAIYNHTLPAVYANFMAKISLNDKADSSYIRYICSNIYNKRIHMDSVNQTTGIQNLDTERYFSRVIAIPNIKEQEKIANFLDKKTSQFDSIISKKEQLIERLEEAKKSLISEVVTGKVKVVKTDDGYDLIKRSSEEMKDSGVEWLGKIPKDWEVKKLKHMAIINPPKSSVKNFLKDDIEVSFVPMDSVRLGYINLNKTKKISEVIDGYTLFEEDDIIMAKVTPCFENRNIAICKGLKNKIGFGSSELNTIRLNYKHDISYMFYHLQEQVFMDISTYEMTGSGGLKRVPTSFLLNSQFAYPSITEKELILSFLENNISVVDTTINKTKFQIEKLKEAKQSLISEAVTGKIEILD